MEPQPTVHTPARIGWAMLRILLIVELVGGAVVLWNVVLAFIAASNEPLGSRLSLLLAVVLSWLWIGITLWGALTRRASWVRGSALTIHILMFPAATGVLQGILGDAAPLGWALLALAVLGFVAAIIARPVPANQNAGETSS
ncbi:hypothetical protein G7068_03110 [Leucobacter viscericola]|uniref:Uncharacterized protein n=1 Tax=Leucobacter viscericola TaxID=2714935 RepID=A0A6G7XCI2_9MICO|nr:hypothetical protein [Leucobacter viscericola]QIK62304.1 hypothetical protein G7068_03110 [Leucobacter viscericola]